MDIYKSIGIISPVYSYQRFHYIERVLKGTYKTNFILMLKKCRENLYKAASNYCPLVDAGTILYQYVWVLSKVGDLDSEGYMITGSKCCTLFDQELCFDLGIPCGIII